MGREQGYFVELYDKVSSTSDMVSKLSADVSNLKSTINTLQRHDSTQTMQLQSHQADIARNAESLSFVKKLGFLLVGGVIASVFGAALSIIGWLVQRAL